MSSFVKASGGLTPNSADPGEEFPFLHTITVVDRVVSVDKPELVQNNIKTETVTLNLDSEWEGLSTVINIGSGYPPTSVIWSGEPVVIPAELMTTVGSLDVSVVGYGDDGGIRAVTKQAQNIFNVVASGYVEGDEPVPDPTTLLGQLIQAADNANQAADRFNQASDDIEGIGPAIEKVQASEANAKQSETNAAASAESASQSASTASASAESARTSETNAATYATSASEASTAAKASETNAASSASAASQSASQAQSSATAAASSAQAASTSAESAKTASDSATSSKDAAAQSASEASTSASAAETSKTNAAASASAAQASETNAAASATAAQQAVDGFGLQVGTTTTGEPGSDAAVEIQKQGTRYTANFTIPRGDVGPAGVNENVPLGSTSGVVAQAKDAYPALPRKVQVHGATSGGNSVEPEKLTILGENLLDLSFIMGHPNARVSGDEIIFKLDVDGNNDSYTYNNVLDNPYVGDTKYLIPVIPNSRLHFKAETSEPITSSSIIAFYGSAYNLVKNFIKPNVSGNIQSLDFDVPSGAAFVSVRLGVRDAEQDATIIMRNICLSYTDIEYVPPEKIETNLPSDISLADGDTLTIDHDGTTQILHADGEPTVLENVTLPELPAPTFNVYTTGGYVPPTVDVDYEKDVNLVLEALEAKIAALQVADKTN